MRSISRRDAIGAAVLTAAGVGLRLLFGAAFPTEPVSDFRGLVLFGLRLRDEGFAVAGWHWVQFSPGLPLLLSVLFRVFPRNVAAVARISTEVATGLVPLLPYWIWSRVVGWRWRFLAGLLLALWPGLVFFSGVAAQENWALLPVVALAALAVRRLRDPREGGRPLTAGLLYFAAAAIRQEMLVVMAPVAIAAAGLPGRPRGRAARLLRLGAAAAVPLLALAGERFAATGRFSITTEHGGLGALGTVAPGSSAVGWTDPTLYAASIDPGLLEDPRRLRREAWRLAWEEARRRYRYHAFRSAVLALRLSVRSEADAAFWSLEAPGALPPDRAAAGGTWARAATPFLEIELALLSGLFLAAAFRGLRRRDAAILVLAAAVAAQASRAGLVLAARAPHDPRDRTGAARGRPRHRGSGGDRHARRARRVSGGLGPDRGAPARPLTSSRSPRGPEGRAFAGGLAVPARRGGRQRFRPMRRRAGARERSLGRSGLDRRQGVLRSRPRRLPAAAAVRSDPRRPRSRVAARKRRAHRGRWTAPERASSAHGRRLAARASDGPCGSAGRGRPRDGARRDARLRIRAHGPGRKTSPEVFRASLSGRPQGPPLRRGKRPRVPI